MPEEPQQLSRVAEAMVADLRRLASNDPPRSRPRAAKPIADVVEHLLQHYRIGRDSPEHLIRDHWKDIVGGAGAAYSHPVRLERNLLTVAAAHAVVRDELFHHRDEIVARIRRLPGCDKVKAIRLRVG